MIALSPRARDVGAPLDPLGTLLVVDGTCVSRLETLEELIDVAAGLITVAAVPCPLGWLAPWAPLSGLTTQEWLRADLAAEAEVVAAGAAAAVGGVATVLPDWAGVIRLVGEATFAVAVICVAPRPARVRRALTRASLASGTALVLAPVSR